MVPSLIHGKLGKDGTIVYSKDGDFGQDYTNRQDYSYGQDYSNGLDYSNGQDYYGWQDHSEYVIYYN